jgi:hypothetical protein
MPKHREWWVGKKDLYENKWYWFEFAVSKSKTMSSWRQRQIASTAMVVSGKRMGSLEDCKTFSEFGKILFPAKIIVGRQTLFCNRATEFSLQDV